VATTTIENDEMVRTYLMLGLLVLGTMTYAEYRGLSLMRFDEVKNVPKDIRNNPGAYRGLYQRYYFHK
jgi:hypothetical protein